MNIDLKKKNIGGNDRKARLIGGIALIGIGCITKNKLIKVAGCIFTATGLIQKCIFYDILNINTYEESQEEEISLEENR